MANYTLSPGRSSQYLFIFEGRVVGQIEVSWEITHPAGYACQVRDEKYPDALVAVVLGDEPRYVEKEEGTQMPKGFDTKSYHSSEDEQCQ